MSTLGDVAAAAGVSISTVSRVLNGASDARVGAGTRERIVQAAAELRYRPNVAGRSLRSARADAVLLVVPDATNAVFAELLRGVEEAAHERGLALLIARAETLGADGGAVGRLVAEGRVDGIVLQPRDGAPVVIDDSIRHRGLGLVVINSEAEPGPGIMSAVLDDRAAAVAAVEHLRSHGHARIGLLGGLASSSTAQRREDGFRAALRQAGLPVVEEWMTRRGYRPEDGAAGLNDVAGAAAMPSAVVVANVNAAVGALHEARRLGLTVPNDLSIVAIHDSWLAENTWPPLSTVRLPLYELGRSAIAALTGTVGSSGDQHTIVSDPAPVVIARQSVASSPAQ